MDGEHLFYFILFYISISHAQENFGIGLNETANTVFLMDFGLAKRYP